MFPAGDEESLRPDFWSGDEAVIAKEIAERQVGGFCNSNARRSEDVARAKSIVTDPETAGRRCEIASVVASASDTESFGEPSWSAGEFGPVFCAAHFYAASFRHLVDPGKRFDGTEKDAPRLAFGLAGDVQTIIISVDEVDVRVARRAEEDRIPQGASGGRVGGRIIFAEIGFNLDDTGGKPSGRITAVADQDSPQQSTCYVPRITYKECTGERMECSRGRGRCLGHASGC